jgi:hypothetical protein
MCHADVLMLTRSALPRQIAARKISVRVATVKS